MRKTLLRMTVTLAMMVGALAGLAFAWSAPASAETFTVTNSGDSGDNSLRWAIGKANETDAADTITFSPQAGESIGLYSTLTVTKPLTIQGSGMLIYPEFRIRPFYVKETTLNLSALTILRGGPRSTHPEDPNPPPYIQHGAGIFNDGGTLNLEGVRMINNSLRDLTGKGGAVYSRNGSVNIRGSEFSENGGYAGSAIAVEGSSSSPLCEVTVTDSTFYQNFTPDKDGAIYNGSGCRMSVVGSSFDYNGSLSGGGDGGAIFNAGDLTVSGSVLSDNLSERGGGIFNTGVLAVSDSDLLSNGSGMGGGIFNARSGQLTVDRSTFSANQSSAGGGLLNEGTTTVSRSTFSGNVADGVGVGGGVANRGGMRIEESTLFGNSADLGGGIHNGGGPFFPEITARGVTVAGNSGTRNGGVFNEVETFRGEILARLESSIVAGNNTTGAFDPGRGLADGGFNILGGTAGAAGLQTDAQGKPVLAANGGPTKTVALVRGGKAIDAGNSFGSTTDQRGTPRLKDYASADNAQGGDGSDAGAFEYVDPDKAAPTVVATATPSPVNEGVPNNSDVTVAISATDEGGGSGVWRTSYSAGGAQQVTEQSVTGNSAELVVSADGETTVTYWATDGAGNRSENRTITVRVDATAPTVTRATPTGGKVPRAANVTATFSEAMDRVSVEAPGAFTLKKKRSTKAVSATVTYDPDTRKATLDPIGKLRPGATYVAGVSTTATDPAGNALDQTPTTAGNQPKTWSFKVR